MPRFVRRPWEFCELDRAYFLSDFKKSVCESIINLKTKELQPRQPAQTGYFLMSSSSWSYGRNFMISLMALN